MATHETPGGVRTWYDEHGDGEPLVLLHPGGADARAWAPNLDALAARFRVFTPEQRGHGRTPDVDGPITYELMARDTIDFVERVSGGPVHLVGHSAGACLALVVVLRRPDLVRRLVLISGVFHWQGWVPSAIDETASAPSGLDPAVAEKLARMNREEPAFAASDLSRVTRRTLVMLGDDDEVVFDHVVAMYEGIPDAELAVVPGTSHGLLHEKPELCNSIVVDFLTTDPVQTIAPLRRATR